VVTHPVTAQYGGDSNYNSGTSPVLNQVVNKATPAPGSVSVSSSTNPSAFGQSVTFTATVPSDGTGTVTFLDGTNTIGTGTVSNGTATFTTSSLGVGSHSITVSWGDSNYVTTTSAPITQVVNKTGVTVVITSSENPSTYGDMVTFTATLTGVNGVVPTGTVQFTADGVNIGGPVTLDGTGKVSVTLSTLTAGSHTLNATYNGDSSCF